MANVSRRTYAEISQLSAFANGVAAYEAARRPLSTRDFKPYPGQQRLNGLGLAPQDQEHASYIAGLKGFFAGYGERYGDDGPEELTPPTDDTATETGGGGVSTPSTLDTITRIITAATPGVASVVGAALHSGSAYPGTTYYGPGGGSPQFTRGYVPGVGMPLPGASDNTLLYVGLGAAALAAFFLMKK